MQRWKPVVGYEGWYAVSDNGLVRRERKGVHTQVGKLLKPVCDSDGYPGVRLSKNGIVRRWKVHRLVLESFVGQRPLGFVCNHKNGVKDDNRVENLEWVTVAENTQHAYDVLGHKAARGMQKSTAKLNDGIVQAIRSLQGVLTQYQIADLYCIGQPLVSCVQSGKLWKHVA